VQGLLVAKVLFARNYVDDPQNDNDGAKPAIEVVKGWPATNR